ncbi:MAG: hypothetical protein IKP64_04590 [Selenomonadaceae bacterium]|nr:hypothetical protein [Selenomonadaceae bacterium]
MADIQVNVMMFGGRRCGKTSVLAAMQSCFKKAFKSSNLTITTADDDTMFTLEEKNREFAAYFSRGGKRTFTPDNNPTSEISEYQFKIGLGNKRTDNIVVNFIDYPGESLADREKIKELQPIMARSHVIIVAIDSPHLMEETPTDADDSIGEYNDRRNYCYRIGDWVIKFFSGETDFSRMILFVPLKCEKYYHAGEMNVLNKKVHVAYQDALDFFGKNGRAYEVAITPILTLGGADKGVEFSRFERDDEGYIKEDPKFGTPQKAIYQFTKRMNGPEPLHCEQPMVYVLAYVLKVLLQRESGLWDWLKQVFARFASKEDFLRELDNIQANMKISGNGYEIVQNPLGF